MSQRSHFDAIKSARVAPQPLAGRGADRSLPVEQEIAREVLYPSAVFLFSAVATILNARAWRF
jgi:hypothetical protein